MEPRRVLGLFLFLLLFLLLAGTEARVPPESSLEPKSQVLGGVSHLSHPPPNPPQALLEVSPQNQEGDGQPPPSRRRRHSSHFPLCSFCCNCCGNRGCGFCCRT
ncbi:hepcidin isoform X2 [Chiroxiphia lanceolata]|uniref:hepcidin isoform X2 n=1 Tax=Chiroxiphia lanceolata TaxID=296741 RepID=UPI0013CE4C1D|nr:hepcidin isoform X2 [Chiroxiphia lanceolata]